jgi:predicted permease
VLASFFISALLAAVMSSADSSILACSSVLGKNLLPWIWKSDSDQSVLKWTRLSVPIFAVLSMMVALFVALSGSGTIILGLSWWQTPENLPNPVLTTLFQTTTRWNVFITLAAVELFVGPQGVALVALSIAVLVPLINIANVMVLAFFGPVQAQGIPVASHVLKNPLVQACAIGIIINLSGLSLPDFALQTLDLVGRAGLGVGILAVGAGVSAEWLFQQSTAMVFGVVFRMIFGPAVFLVVVAGFGLGQTEVLIGIIVLVGLAASNGYILAKKMGGDANLYADILAWQTILSMLMLPLFILAITTVLG